MITPVIVAKNKPFNLPSPEDIIEQVRAASSNSNGLPGVPLIDESSGTTPYALVRSGKTITMGGALTQQFISKALNGKADTAVRVPCLYLAFQVGRQGFIVMEYIDGEKCDDSDAALISTAVESLVAQHKAQQCR